MSSAADSRSVSVERVLQASADACDRAVDHPMLVRPMDAGDVNWVVNSWLKNARKCPIGKKVRNEIWYDAQHRVLEHIIPRARPLIACHPDSPRTYFGWICGEIFHGAGQEKPDLVLHYCYVKDQFKAHRSKAEGRVCGGQGVGRLLLQTLMNGEEGRIGGVYVSYTTAQGHGWLSRMYDEGTLPFPHTYDPFLLLSSLPRGWY